MIIGLDHIALCTRDVARATARLAELGYAIRFDAPDLDNHPTRAAMLARYRPRHHIRALAAPGAMAIALLNHGPLTDRQAAGLIPVFRSTAPLGGWRARSEDDLPLTDAAWPLLERALGEHPQVFFDPDLDVTLLWIASNEAPGLYACALPTGDRQGTEDMLRATRFRADPATGLWSLPTPLPALQARIVPVPFAAHPGWQARAPLDAPGCPCLALMARGTDRVPLPAALRGEMVSFTLTIDRTVCKITLIRPEHGPVTELVDPQA